MNWLNPYRWVALVGLVAALVLGYQAWADHIGDARETAVRAEYTAAALVAEKAARTTEAAWQTKLTKATQDAKTKQTQLALDAAAARSAADSLRHDLQAARSRLSTLPRDAIEQYADTASVVFAECVQEYQGLAEAADRALIERQTLIDAWPLTD